MSTLGIGVGPQRRMTAYVEDGEVRERLSIWLERLMAAGHLGSSTLRDIRRNVTNRLSRLEPREEGVEVDADLEDVRELFVQDQRIYTHRLIPLDSMLEALLQGPLNQGKGHAGARRVHEVLSSVRDIQTGVPQGSQAPYGGALAPVVGQLEDLARKLGVTSLRQATRTHPMSPLSLPFLVFHPSAAEKAKALKKNPRGQSPGYDFTGQFNRERYEQEVLRQVRIQQEHLNRMRLDRWFMNRDLFNVRVPDRRERITSNRSAGYLGALVDELYLRNADQVESLSRKGNVRNKRQRLGVVSKGLFSQLSSTDALSRLTERSTTLHGIRRGRPFDPEQVPDAEAILARLRELLSLRQETGKVDAEGHSVEEDVVKDLVGRSNAQGAWRKANAQVVATAVKPLLDDWRGLHPMEQGNPLRGLAVLHNPDQVAGGEREIPRGARDLTQYIGPAIVNSALGATWGLPVAGDEDERPLAAQLEDALLEDHPEEGWPLWELNLVLEVLFGHGSHVIPPRR
ncbi:polymorphic toxin type 15 domain-containing protein [Myxococcus sp. K15C18031901]|uniref:polymorphic toxin type 15 domain-containing protein n=1 Tax=Myxococcus dinghuensis TaxID=2906761 RepID=UPI0020A8092C|nr:polymorphic toxin type 15 domain-containing protein [Myxococcus dinghuensis]MCP3100553.1 polymorphic toxin type 15 domain-containing protein [Myxococcus dinghuensis]